MSSFIAATGGDPGLNLQSALILNPTNSVSAGSVFSSLASFLNLFLPLSFIIAGIILLFLLIGGGFSIIASGGNAKSMEQGKNAITGAILGFFIIFCAYWVIQIIQVVTGLQIFNSGL